MSHHPVPPGLPPLSSIVSLSVLDAMPFPVFVHRPDGTVEHVNRVATAFWGVPLEAVVGKYNVFEQEGAFDPALLAAFREVATGETRTVEPAPMDLARVEKLSEHSRRVAHVESTLFPLRGPDGQVAYVVTVQRDVTELVEKREGLRAAAAEIAEQRELIGRLEVAQREIAEQRATIQELQSPIIEVWDGVLTMPILGALTEARAGAMLDRALAAVSAAGARHFILDLTGSEQVDTATGSHLLGIVRAVTLLGAEAMIAGIRPHTAQTMVTLGLGLDQVRTYRNLREALRSCMSTSKSDRGPDSKQHRKRGA